MRKLIATLSLVVAGLVTAQIAKADTCNGVTANLVTNCSFEAGSFSGWTGSTTTDVNSGVDSLQPYVGTYEAYLGTINTTSTLSQSVSTTAGVYRIIFAVLNDTTPTVGYTNGFQALFGTTSLLNESAVVAGNYIVYNFLAATTASSTTLSFVSRNDQGYFDLDSVSVSQAPEPSSLILLGTGALGLMGVARRRLKI